MGQPGLTEQGLPGRRWMRCVVRTMVLGGTGLWLAAAQAQPLSFTCPWRLASQAASVAEIPGAAFKHSFLPTSLTYLLGVAVLEAGRADSTEIAPAISGSQWHWNLEGIKPGAVVACRYEGGMLLARSLAPGLRECMATVQRTATRGVDGYGVAQANVSCR
jgi:hypothetical protein